MVCTGACAGEPVADRSQLARWGLLRLGGQLHALDGPLTPFGEQAVAILALLAEGVNPGAVVVPGVALDDRLVGFLVLRFIDAPDNPQPVQVGLPIFRQL